MQGRKTYTVEEAQLALESYCSYQDRSHKEVEEKLRKMNMIPAACEVIIQHLIQENYLNETRFAQSFARGKFRIKNWGRQRITRELKLRGISSYNIKLALKEISETEYQETFNVLAEKRWDQLKRESSLQRRRQKFLNYMQYRGWENGLIFQKLDELSR
ncbi:regulatory protein RecX [Aureitalea marina]|uniref:Regulatory protein RecX n=1 Tax=Aureitalea marina TaxID=930804 RepID=A0A2S7KST3_9FLAO|nr:regulatory protein RecX [Aureitalea marina]PQB05676.1 recombinase RecX [Aureitalea marina]